MAMACGQTPDHSTIAHFVSSMQDLILSVFRDILLVCEKEGLLGGTSFSLDGLKLPSDASNQMSGTFSELEHKKKKLEERIGRLLKKEIEKDKKDKEDEGRKDHQNKEKQIRRLKRRAEKIGRFLEENEPRKSSRGNKELKNNVTDNDSVKACPVLGTGWPPCMARYRDIIVRLLWMTRIRSSFMGRLQAKGRIISMW